jgi:hypothetical protein
MSGFCLYRWFWISVGSADSKISVEIKFTPCFSMLLDI